jgi:hypothetical protein
VVTQIVHHLGIADDRATNRGQRLAEGDRDQIRAIAVAEMCRGAAALAEHPDRMRVVYDQPGSVPAADLSDLRQPADVALHRVHAVDHHKPASVGPADR